MEFLARSVSYQKFLRVLLFASPFIFLVPPRGLWFGFFPRQEFVFQVVIGIGLILCAVWVAWIRPEKVNRNVVQELTGIDKAVLGLSMAYLLATLLAPNFHRSFFGILDRMTGFISFAYAVGYYALIRIALSKDDVFRLLCWTSLSIGLAGGYALLQSAALIDSEFGLFGRPVGPFANSALLATYLLFGIFLSLFSWLRLRTQSTRDPLWLSITLLSALSSFAGLIATQTRAAFLGVVAGALVLAVVLLFDSRSSWRIRRIGIITLALLGLIGIFVCAQLIFAPFDLGYTLFSRLTDADDLLSGFFNRSVAWQLALEAFGDRPVLGWGLDNYAQPFDAHFDTRLVEDEVMAEAWFDKAHNVFLDVLATTGAIGLAGFLAFLGSVFHGAWTLCRRQQLHAPLIALLGAYVVNGLLIFDSFQSTVLLFGVAATVSTGMAWASPLRQSGKARHMQTWLVPGLAVIVCTTIAYATIAYSVIPLRGFGLHYQARQQMNRGDERASATYSKDFELQHPYTLYDWEYLSLVLLANPERFEKEFFQHMATYAFEQFAAFEQRHAVTARDYYLAARLGNLTGDMSERTRAHIWQYLERAQKLSPDKPDVYFEMAQYYKNSSDYSRAIDVIKRVERHNPNIAVTYMNLGLAYAAARDFGKAIDAFETSFDRGYDGWKESAAHVDLLWQVYTIEQYIHQHVGRLAEILEAQSKLDGGKDANTWSQLAAVYQELKQYDKARAAALKAVEIYPAAKAQAEEFLQNLPD